MSEVHGEDIGKRIDRGGRHRWNGGVISVVVSVDAGGISSRQRDPKFNGIVLLQRLRWQKDVVNDVGGGRNKAVRNFTREELRDARCTDRGNGARWRNVKGT